MLAEPLPLSRVMMKNSLPPELANERKTGCKFLVLVSFGYAEHVAGPVGIRFWAGSSFMFS